jgi:hypothetical protein
MITTRYSTDCAYKEAEYCLLGNSLFRGGETQWLPGIAQLKSLAVMSVDGYKLEEG